jgi:hypothetical protein
LVVVVVAAATEENGLGGVRKREKNVWSEKVDWKGLMAIKSQKCQIGFVSPICSFDRNHFNSLNQK